MTEIKTKPTKVSVKAFLDAVENESRRKDSYVVLKMLKDVTKQQPKMWGPTIVGFGTYHYKYESGREGDICRIGFSPRKASFSFYLGAAFNRDSPLMAKLGTHKLGPGGCLYINKLADVDTDVLKQLMIESLKNAPEFAKC